MPKTFWKQVGPMTEKFQELQKYLGKGKPLLLFVQSALLPNNHLFVHIVIKLLTFNRVRPRIRRWLCDSRKTAEYKTWP